MDHKKSYDGVRVRGENKKKIPCELLNITHHRQNNKLSQETKFPSYECQKNSEHVPKSPTPYHRRPDDRARTRSKNRIDLSQPAKQPLFLPRLRSRARVAKVWSREGETNSFKGFSPTRVGERTWERGRELELQALLAKMSPS